MKTFLRCVVLACVAVAPLAHADIYKCVVRHTVTYRDTPCPNADESELIIASLRAERNEVARTAPADSVTTDVLPEVPVNLAEPSPELMLGMFDTQVLNLRGWGRPAKITRSKAKGAWREEWTYVSPRSGERQLQFANGRLTAIGTLASF